MGAYLSEPITKKISSDESGKNVAFGASSMQGWRVRQEDAHNCCIEFDENTSLFAVYDGHGGHEVATYCAKELPSFIKNTDAYKNGNIKEALIDAFLGFDAALAKPDIINVLKEIAGTNDNERDKDLCVSGDDEESVSDLRMEAAMPLEQVMARYQTESDPSWTRARDENEDPCTQQSIVSSLYSRCRRERATRWPMGPSCSSSSSSWNADEQDVSSSSQACSSSAVSLTDDVEKKSASPNGEPSLDSTTSNGVIDPDSSDDTGIANTLQKIENTTVNDVNGEQSTKAIIANAADSSKTLGDKVSSSSSESLENGKSKESDKVIDCESTIIAEPSAASQTLLQKAKEIGRRKFRVVTVKQREVDADEDDNDDDDDDEENDETFNVSPVGCDDDTDDMDDDDDDDDDEDGEDKDDEEDDSSEDEQDDDSKEGDEDDGDFTMDMTEEPGSDSGCTAVVAILHDRDLYVGNAGDSRCVLCRDGQALELSLDHKPEDQPEMERIVKAGGKVTADGRVNGGLNLSRALGDHAYKQNTTLPLHEQMISALPDVRHITIDHNRDEFMILACDGIWNFMSSQEVVAFVRPRLIGVDQPDISKICEELFDHCLAPDTLGDGTGCDNMTAVIVKFKHGDSTSDLPSTNFTIVQSSISKKRPISPSNETSVNPENEGNSNNEGCNSTTTKNNDSESGDCKRPKTEIH